MLCHGPKSEVSEELGKCGRLVVGVEAARVGKDPGVAAPERDLLQADTGVFIAGDNAVGTDANEGDDGGVPAFDFGFEALAAGTKFVDRKFIGASGCAETMLVMPNLRSSRSEASKGEKRRGVNSPPWRAGQKRFPGRPK